MPVNKSHESVQAIFDAVEKYVTAGEGPDAVVARNRKI